ncbi:MAG: pirin family protein [Candidatus Moraniibacteriota bacterium]
MKIRFFPAKERGHVTWDWLDTYHSFSFGHFYDPDLMGFGLLRVVNDDTIAPGAGFGKHPHQNMEIITIPLTGGVEHTDNTGAHSITQAGSVQVMSAGKLVAHSEVNASKTEPLSLFQIWIEPNTLGIEPRYDEKEFHPEEQKGKWQLMVSNDAREGSLMIHQNAFISMGQFKKDERLDYALHDNENGVFVMAVEGRVKIADQVLKRRDALGLSENQSFSGEALEDAQIMAIEVPLE